MFSGTAAPWILSAMAFVFGACIGSFLNVVIHRLPRGESIVRPSSHCACGHAIAWRDNIPIFSWFLLRGRARCCGRQITARYPLVEALTAALFLACWRNFPPLPAVCGWIFLSALVAAAFIDLDHMIIPDVFTVGLAVAGILLAMLVPASHGQHSGYFALDSLRSTAAALVGLLIGSGLLLWIATLAELILKKDAMGFGDVKLVGAIGAFCGWHGAVFAIFGGALVGSVSLALVLVGRKIIRPGRPGELGFGTQVPFGPMLAAAGAIYFLAVHREVDHWFGQVALLF